MIYCWPLTAVMDDDIMAVTADNILDFSLQCFVDFFKEKGTYVIMCHNEPELKNSNTQK